MDKKYLNSFIETKSIFYVKPFSAKKQTQNRQNDISLNPSGHKKYIPDEQSSKLILNYFEYNNFQDFNTWQQIAKTKTDYKFEEIPGEKIECQLVFKWQTNDKENINLKKSAKNKKSAKRKALVQLLEILMSKGLISYGFKEKNFTEKLPRRKRYESSSSQEENEVSQRNNTKRATLFGFMKENNIEGVIETLNFDNISEVWNWGLSKKSLDLIERVLEKIFRKMVECQKTNEESNINHASKKRVLKQVSYVEQSKDPFEEDLTVFIRYYQLQRTKYQQKSFNRFPISKGKNIEMSLPSQGFMQKFQKGFKIENYMQFTSIQQISQVLAKKKSSNSEVQINKGFFDDLKEIYLPKFDEDIEERKVFSIKIIDKMFHHLFYITQDYEFSLKVLSALLKSLENIDFYHTNSKKIEELRFDKTEQSSNKRAEKYYIGMKGKLLTQILYNLSFKMSEQNLNRSISIEGMLNFSSSLSKYDGIFQFVSKQPEQITSKKIQKKSNLNEFLEQYEFCIDEVVLLVNKINQKTYIGLIKELNQSFKIYVPFLIFEFSIDFPAPFTVYKVLNTKIYNKISSALVHVCKYYINDIEYEIGGGKNVILIYQTPSGPHQEVIEEMLAEFIAKKLFVLIVSENYNILSKVLNEKGFKCITISLNSDEKIVSKNNIILTNKLNVCTDSMKSIAFDRVIIDEAHQIPEVISLLSAIKCTKKLYLIGDPNLPRGEMKSPLSKQNQVEMSLFQRYLESGSPYIFLNSYQSKQDTQIFNPQFQSKIFDYSIVEWLTNSIYGSSIITDLQKPKKKTPLIKGFNWPSNQYKLCFINVPQTSSQSREKLINEECFLITWIIAEVLKSGFTELDQITCCSIDSTLIPILQQHLFKILVKLNIQPLQWQIIFQRLIKSLTGSVWDRNDLIIVLASNSLKIGLDDQIQSKNYDIELGKKLTSALLQAKRGLIIVGDINQLSAKSSMWSNFIDWMVSKRLILSYTLPKSSL